MDINEIKFDENGNIDFDSLNKYMEANFPQPKARWWHRFRREYIVSTYFYYENITTEMAVCKLFLRFRLHRKGCSTLKDMFYPPRRVSLFLLKWFKWNTFNFNSNCTIEKYVPNTGQITHHCPLSYMDR